MAGTLRILLRCQALRTAMKREQTKCHQSIQSTFILLKMLLKFKDKNFIGVDIKGARMFIGATESKEEKNKIIKFKKFIIKCYIMIITSCKDLDKILNYYVYPLILN